MGVISVGVLIVCGLFLLGISTLSNHAEKTDTAQLAEQSRRVGDVFYPGAKQWASLIVEPVIEQVFRAEHLTEGKIAVDEDRATLVFSPYSGRVIKLMAKPGDQIKAGSLCGRSTGNGAGAE